MRILETELLLRANDFQANLATQVITKFITDPGLFLAELEHWRGIDTIYFAPIRGVILDEEIQKLKYDGPISVDKQEGI